MFGIQKKKQQQILYCLVCVHQEALPKTVIEVLSIKPRALWVLGKSLTPERF
jgi:hypothetical protein